MQQHNCPSTSRHSTQSLLPPDEPHSTLLVDGTVDLVHIIPGFTWGLSSKAYKQVLKDWEQSNLDWSVYVLMKDWKPEWHKNTGQTQKYGQHQTVALEFID